MKSFYEHNIPRISLKTTAIVRHLFFLPITGKRVLVSGVIGRIKMYGAARMAVQMKAKARKHLFWLLYTFISVIILKTSTSTGWKSSYDICTTVTVQNVLIAKLYLYLWKKSNDRMFSIYLF